MSAQKVRTLEEEFPLLQGDAEEPATTPPSSGEEAATTLAADPFAAMSIDSAAGTDSPEQSDPPQDDTGATYAKKLSPQEARIRWSDGAQQIERDQRSL